jgi:thiamine-phosphate pyrophosphorylase
VTAARVSGLYAVTPDISDTSRLVELTRAALIGGVRFLQYRNKAATPALRLAQALALKNVCNEHGAALIVNDHVDIALAADAAGVHLGKEDGLARDARGAIGSARLIGVSCYDSLERGHAALHEGADYVAFGSFFPSRVKPNAVKAPIELVSKAKAAFPVPIVAIGGITLENAPSLVRQGVDAVAVISALFEAPDVTDAARRFTALFEQPR